MVGKENKQVLVEHGGQKIKLKVGVEMQLQKNLLLAVNMMILYEIMI